MIPSEQLEWVQSMYSELLLVGRQQMSERRQQNVNSVSIYITVHIA